MASVVNAQQPATLVVTPPDQPNVVIVAPQIGQGAQRVLLQLQRPIWKSKRFYGFLIGLISLIAATWVGILNHVPGPALFTTSASTLVGLVYALYGAAVADGPLGLTGTDMVKEK